MKLNLNRKGLVVNFKSEDTCKLLTGLYSCSYSNARQYFYLADNKTWYYCKAFDNYQWHKVEIENSSMLLSCEYKPSYASDIIFAIESIKSDMKREDY